MNRTAATFRDFEEALKRHDWTYAYSDDHSYWMAGEASSKRIAEMGAELVNIDSDKVARLYEKYAKIGLGEVESGTGKQWVKGIMQKNEHDRKQKQYVAALMMLLRKAGSTLGKIIHEGSYEMDNLWTYYVQIVTDDGSKLDVAASEWRGGSMAGVGYRDVKFDGRYLRYNSVSLREVETALKLKGQEALDTLRKKSVASAAGELLKVAKSLVAGDDPMEAERIGGLFMELHTWATKKGTSLPAGAPVAVQILESLGKVERRLKGKGNLHGREAVRAMLEAMSGLFTVDASPVRRLWRKYGDEVEEMIYEYRLN